MYLRISCWYFWCLCSTCWTLLWNRCCFFSPAYCTRMTLKPFFCLCCFFNYFPFTICMSFLRNHFCISLLITSSISSYTCVCNFPFFCTCSFSCYFWYIIMIMCIRISRINFNWINSHFLKCACCRINSITTWLNIIWHNHIRSSWKTCNSTTSYLETLTCLINKTTCCS